MIDIIVNENNKSIYSFSWNSTILFWVVFPLRRDYSDRVYSEKTNDAFSIFMAASLVGVNTLIHATYYQPIADALYVINNNSTVGPTLLHIA